jgi:DNA-binding NarL/FixJ family response regulator
VIRVFLLEDQEVVREGTRVFIEAEDDLEVVGEAATIEEALLRIPATRPDVALLDVRFPDGDGVEACREIRSRWPVECIMFTSFADEDALFAAIMAGAAGYLRKEIRGREVADAVRRVGSGQSLLDPVSTGKVLERLRGGGTQVDNRVKDLTGQEQRILELVAEGMTNKQIGERMYLSEKTVKNYVSRVLSKLGFERRTEAAVYATRLERRRDDQQG